MVAFPVASPASKPEDDVVMVRASDDAQAKFAVTSLLEPSLKVAMAFNWVLPPMATVACAGSTATEVNSAAAAAALAVPSSAVIVLAPVNAELTLAPG